MRQGQARVLAGRRAGGCRKSNSARCRHEPGRVYLEPELSDEVGGCVHSSFSPTAGTGGLKADEQDHVLPAMPGLSARERAGTRYT